MASAAQAATRRATNGVLRMLAELRAEMRGMKRRMETPTVQPAATLAPAASSPDAATVLAAAIGGAFEGLGKGLQSMVSAAAQQQESTSKILEMLMTHAAKRATSERMSTLGKSGAAQKAERAATARPSPDDVLTRLRAYCEECWSEVAGSHPTHNRDMARHSLEGHTTQLPAIRQAIDGNRTSDN